jgi:hypothetical protein
MYVILFITHHWYHSLTHLKTTAIEIQGIKIIKKNETRRKEHSIDVAVKKTSHSSALMRFLCKTSHKDSWAWPCLTWHCQPIKSAEYNQWSPLLRVDFIHSFACQCHVYYTKYYNATYNAVNTHLFKTALNLLGEIS